jgi:hypothetical protein
VVSSRFMTQSDRRTRGRLLTTYNKSLGMG